MTETTACDIMNKSNSIKWINAPYTIYRIVLAYIAVR